MIERILSITSEYSVLSEESEQDERENKRTKSSFLYLVLSFFIFVLICMVVFLFTYTSFAERSKEFSCPPEDPVCLSLLCPVGMSWDNASEECSPPSGYRCCVDNANIFTCFRDATTDDRCSEDILASGVAPSPLAMCYPGFVWVPRIKQCVQTIG